jgi:hypothetical protein
VRRVMFTVAASVLLAGAVPATALAHHHHHKHHARHHAQIRRFGDQNTAPTSMSASDNAGTVQSFQNGALTIALNTPTGSTVSGMVTSDTEIECVSTQQSQTTHDDGDPGSGGSQNSTGTNQNSTGTNQSSTGTDQGDDDQSEAQSGESNSGDDDQGEDQSSSCSTSNLTMGAVVHEATLRIGSSGAVWEKVELVS